MTNENNEVIWRPHARSADSWSLLCVHMMQRQRSLSQRCTTSCYFEWHHQLMTQIKVQYVLNNMRNGLRKKHSVQSLNLGKSPPPWKRQSSLWPVPSWVVVALQTWSMCRRGWVSSAEGDSMNQLHGTGTQNRVLAPSTVASSRYGALSHSTTLLLYWLIDFNSILLAGSIWCGFDKKVSKSTHPGDNYQS